MRRRTILAGLLALVAALAVLAGVRLYPSSGRDIGLASPDGDLSCSVRTPDCLPGEVEVFKIWSTSNSHAGTVAGSSYPYRVCCVGPVGLSTDASGCYATVLTLSADDNAHAAEPPGYVTEVTLSAPETAIDCVYDTSCDTGAGYACVASISGSDNAHVADCGGGAYPTKVCCRALPDANSDSGPPPPLSYTGAIGNGPGIPDDDATVPNGDDLYDACDPDHDNDGIPDGSDPDPGGDITYDDNGNGDPCPLMGTDAADDGPSWDANCNGVLDGVEGSCPLAANPNGDDDGDGLVNTFEVCKWGTDKTVIDTDGDTLGDCVEAADVNGDGFVNFVGDVIYHAKAALLPTAAFGKDGDFDINGDGFVNFVGDVIQEAKFGLIPGLCK